MTSKKPYAEDVFPPSKLSEIFIPGPSGLLEVLTTFPQAKKCVGVAIICHPDPQAEGTMHNKVVTTCAKALDSLGYATLRFNYRGVGRSDGCYGDVAGETDDALAVADWVQERFCNVPILWAGFSFGSYIAAYCASKTTSKFLISIAPPVPRFPFATLKNISCPWQVIQGDLDDVVNPAAVVAWCEQAQLTENISLEIIHGAGHFFHGKLILLRQFIEDAVEPVS